MEKQLSLLANGEKQALTPVTIFIDGAARGNPGPAGAGIFMLLDSQPVLQKGLYLGHKTNNQAEYLALVFALLFAQQIIQEHVITRPHLLIFSDSELLVKQMKGIYKVKNPVLAQLKSFIDNLLNHHSYHFAHVFREKNTQADKLANLGVDKKHKVPAAFLKTLSDFGLSI